MKSDIFFGSSNIKRPLTKSSFVLRTLGVVSLLINNVRTAAIKTAIKRIFFLMVIGSLLSNGLLTMLKK